MLNVKYTTWMKHKLFFGFVHKSAFCSSTSVACIVIKLGNYLSLYFLKYLKPFIEHKHCSGFLSELYLCNSGINCLSAQHEQV